LTSSAVPPSLEFLEAIHERKTGAMILVSLRLGAAVAGADAAQTAALAEYGRRLGLAFQITDDLLDVCGQQADVGKRVGKDADRSKLTFPGLLGVAESRRRAEQLSQEAREALRPLGSRAGNLEALARYVLERNR
jgi:geranylgeranyl diphosphate synthase type II